MQGQRVKQIVKGLLRALMTVKIPMHMVSQAREKLLERTSVKISLTLMIALTLMSAHKLGKRAKPLSVNPSLTWVEATRSPYTVSESQPSLRVTARAPLSIKSSIALMSVSLRARFDILYL
jgi:hypothetical protein